MCKSNFLLRWHTELANRDVHVRGCYAEMCSALVYARPDLQPVQTVTGQNSNSAMTVIASGTRHDVFAGVNAERCAEATEKVQSTISRQGAAYLILCDMARCAINCNVAKLDVEAVSSMRSLLLGSECLVQFEGEF